MPGTFDRIRDTTTFSGTLSVSTAFTVANAPPLAHQTFRNRYTTSDVNIPVTIVGQSSGLWQVCYCSYTATDQLTVTEILYSSNSDAAVTFSGTSDVFVGPSVKAIAHLREPNTFTGNNTFPNTGLRVLDTNASHSLIIAPGSNITADRTLTVTTGDANRTVTLNGDTTLTGTNTGDQTITLTGDVTGSGTGSFAATIASNAVTLAKMATVATDSILGRATAATGNVEVLTALPFAYTGDVTRAADSNTTVLAAGNAGNLNSGTLLAARMPALTGDVTTTAGTVATTISNSVVTLAKMADLAQNRIIGRVTASTGVPEALTPENLITIFNAAATGTVNVARGGTGAGTLTGVLRGNGTSAFTAGNVSLTTEVTGTLPVGSGGTGATTLTGVLKGNGTAAFSASNVSLTAEVTGTLPVGNGGSGATTLTGVLKGNGASAFTAGSVSLTTEVTGTLPVGNGGTGITSLGTGVATWLGTPSSTNLANAVTDETGSGSLVFASSPTLSTPTINGGTIQSRPQASSETTGTLTSASANKTIQATGNITINNSVFSAGDIIVIYAGGTSRTLTAGAGVTMRLAGTATTGNRTIPSFGIAVLFFASADSVAVGGSSIT